MRKLLFLPIAKCIKPFIMTPAALIELRRKLHQIAEVSGEEKESSQLIAGVMESLSPDSLLKNIGGYGLAAVWKGKQPGPRLLFRADMDALPIEETNRFAHRSLNEGVSHKCGHDGHSTILLGLAQRLREAPPAKGEVVLLFQPAEETGQGANQVLADEKWKNIKPDMAFALHNLPGFKTNTVVWRNETFASASVGLKVDMTGHTAHASQPETGLSPALAMANIMQKYLAILLKGPDHDGYANLTITHAQLGEKAVGTAPGHARIWATLRSYDDDVLRDLKQKCNQIAEEEANNNGLKLEIDWQEPFSATVNDPGLNAYLIKAAKSTGLAMQEVSRPFRWSEDFGHFGSDTSICLFGLGAGKNQPALHNPDYDFPDELIQPAVAVFDDIRIQICGKSTRE